MEGSLNDTKRRNLFRLGVGLLGLTLLASFAFTQLAYETYTQAGLRNRQLQTRMDNFLTVRGKINGVVGAFSGTVSFANPSLAIDQRVWNLQMAWNDFRNDAQDPWSGARFLTPAPSVLDAAIDQFALTSLRNAVALRRSNSSSPAQLAETAMQRLEPELAAVESQIAQAIVQAEKQRESAMTGIAYGRGLTYGAFFALASLLTTGLFVAGMRNFKEWMGRGPVSTIEPNKLASPQR